MDATQERMVKQYMGLAQSIAVSVWRTAPHALDLPELTSIAYLGLVAAADRWVPYCRERSYDPGREEYFEPFVKRRVRGAVMDALRASDWATRSLRFKARQLQQAGQDQGATIAEMAARTSLSEKDVRATMSSMAQRPVSIEGEEIDKASPQSVESSAYSNELLQVLVAAVAVLERECQVVIALHYFEERELQDVAALMGITESRASHLHTKSVLEIRKALIDAVGNTR